jgi:hypothetical protein
MANAKQVAARNLLPATGPEATSGWEEIIQTQIPDEDLTQGTAGPEGQVWDEDFGEFVDADLVEGEDIAHQHSVERGVGEVSHAAYKQAEALIPYFGRSKDDRDRLVYKTAKQLMGGGIKI